jgi:adenosylmethionine-8-amino-7-oxononanoate aminotransferase
VKLDSAPSTFYIPVWYGGTPEERSATPSNTVVRTEGMTNYLADGTSFEDWTGTMYVNNIGMGRGGVSKALADASLRLRFPELLSGAAHEIFDESC